MKINVGCGLKKLEGYINIDIDPRVSPDLIRDIGRGLPFNNEVIDEIRCFHILEHVKNLIFVMNEFWRILKVGGKVIIESPHINGVHAWIDPNHCRFFNERSFDFFRIPDMGSLSSGVYGFYNLSKGESSGGFISLTLIKESHEETVNRLKDGEYKERIRVYLKNMRSHYEYE